MRKYGSPLWVPQFSLCLFLIVALEASFAIIYACNMNG